MTETEQIIVGLISSAGQSKSLAFEALKKVKTGEYDEAFISDHLRIGICRYRHSGAAHQDRKSVV